MRLFLAVCAQLMASSASAQHVTDEIDRFTGDRKIAYTAAGVKHPGQPIVTLKTFTLNGDTLVMANFGIFPPPTGRYGVQRFAYNQCHEVNWLADGKPVAMGQVTYSFQRINTSLVEIISQHIPIEKLREIGSAMLVEYRICNSEFWLTQTDLAAARIIAEKLAASP